MGKADTAAMLTGNLRNLRAWIAMVYGVFGLGFGLGLMLAGGLGVAPLDVLFSGVAVASGWSVGTIVIVSYFVMVVVSWPLGIRPGVGTVLCVVGVGPLVDVALRFGDHYLTGASFWQSVLCWFIGMFLFSSGVVGLFAADLGVSPYDQITRAASIIVKRSLGVGRLLVDSSCFIVGFLLGGSWGVGTVVLLGVLPAALTWILPRVRKVVVR